MSQIKCIAERIFLIAGGVDARYATCPLEVRWMLSRPLIHFFLANGVASAVNHALRPSPP